jgi:signal transduction histidine kinase
LLTLARQPEKVELIPESLQPIVSSVIKRLAPLAEAKHITIKKDLSDVKVMGDKASIVTVVGVLLDNAIKYSPPKAEVWVEVSRKDGHGLVTITDHGPGIAEADLPHIFERFYRADSSRTSGDVAGNGLGLSIAQKIVATAHGSITARSEAGKGSAFILRLPIAS